MNSDVRRESGTGKMTGMITGQSATLAATGNPSADAVKNVTITPAVAAVIAAHTPVSAAMNAGKQNAAAAAGVTVIHANAAMNAASRIHTAAAAASVTVIRVSAAMNAASRIHTAAAVPGVTVIHVNAVLSAEKQIADVAAGVTRTLVSAAVHAENLTDGAGVIK
jgi:hypothetical protein